MPHTERPSCAHLTRTIDSSNSQLISLNPDTHVIFSQTDLLSDVHLFSEF